MTCHFGRNRECVSKAARSGDRKYMSSFLPAPGTRRFGLAGRDDRAFSGQQSATPARRKLKSLMLIAESLFSKVKRNPHLKDPVIPAGDIAQTGLRDEIAHVSAQAQQTRQS